MILCGIDEAGRGPLAGPVVAAAVVLPSDFPRDVLDDSKKLSPARRTAAAKLLWTQAAGIGTGWVWPAEIDALNIHHASLLAMERAYAGLAIRADRVLVDGKFPPKGIPEAEAIIGGDHLVDEIKAASIIAKTVRDAWMIRYSWIEPEYGYDRHKGYPTRAHREVCLRLGPSPIQRRSFAVNAFETS